MSGFPVKVLEKGAVYLNRSRNRWRIEQPQDVAKAFREAIGKESREVFIVFLLSARHTVRYVYVVSIGTLDSSLVHPREVFAEAVKRRAAAFIVAHNHPSGDPSPSPDDVRTTERLKRAGELLGIQLLDHVILGDADFVSMKEQGVL
ncbi:MAG: DNA repair protein RadC [Candidatus Eisenbacteria bacterium]|uniref:DNA repair protein RadC n=1 Tax=Eiseniibacteriota bacterium TaxID=2212470 RepID=A0A948W7S8_UNCEI|nr:DNA repair protein RadC [Candidatus Eisenbacteria bacterium]MBU2692919.1 DNA repair protein RadC [Candidatus Eisenbacteria bacterium]